MPKIDDALSKLGPCLTSELAQELVAQGLSYEAARKSISRHGPHIATLSGVVFPHKVRFIYFKDDFGTENYWKSLINCLSEKSPTYGCAIQSLLQRNGIMPLTHFLISCGSPVKQKGHISASRIVENLAKINILEKFSDDTIGECIKLASLNNNEFTNAILNVKARIFIENILIEYIAQWMKNISLVSYNKISLRTDSTLPQTSTYLWDISGPSYLFPLKKISKSKTYPGSIICDLLLRTEITEKGIMPFIKKYTTLTNIKNANKSLYFIIADKFSSKALNTAKAQGIIPATPENLFGKEVAKNLNVLFSLLVRVTKLLEIPESISKVYELLRRLGKIEGMALNLRGALFPFLVAELLRSEGFLICEFGYEIKDDNSKIIAEVDLVLKHGTKEIVYIECKGNDPGSSVNDEEVSRWLKKLTIWRNDFLQHREWSQMKFRAEFWATGIFSEDAKQRIEYKKNTTNKFTIDYLDNSMIAKRAREANNSALLDTLKEHFLRHPLNDSHIFSI